MKIVKFNENNISDDYQKYTKYIFNKFKLDYCTVDINEIRDNSIIVYIVITDEFLQKFKNDTKCLKVVFDYFESCSSRIRIRDNKIYYVIEITNYFLNELDKEMEINKYNL